MRLVQETSAPELYMALETEQGDQQILQSLTTDVMKWSKDVWFMDLSRYYGYWVEQAGRAGLSLFGLWRKLFNHLLGEEEEDPDSRVISLSPAYRACCAHNPWSAGLLLQVMKARDVNGLISLHSKFGQSLFREISWEIWWKQIERIEVHLLRSKIKGYQQQGFRQQCRRLQLAIPRLDFKKPGEMAILNRQGVKKRFGETLATIWEWTYGNDQGPAQTIYQTRFPWKPRHFGVPPCIRRNLDYPLLLWEQFVPLLVEDFDKLCRSTANSGERVTRMAWTLTFENMNRLTIPILFRNPHNLQEEKGHHITPLLQANYGFIDTIKEAFPYDPKNEHYETMPLILGWELKMTECLYLPDIVLDIFGEGQEKGGELDILLRLENELPVNLNRFYACEDWFPEDSFALEHFDTEAVTSGKPEIRRSLKALAEMRPLFIRRQPLPMEQIERTSSVRFLESTMSKWWKVGKCSAKERNYFKQIDAEGNALWVFRDSSGRWYQHGVFG